MKRWCLSKIFEVTTGDPNYWTHQMAYAYGLTEFTRANPETDPETGLPTEKAILVLVESNDFEAIAEDADIVLMPDVSLSAPVMGGIDTVEKANAKAKIVTLGFTEQEVGDAWQGSYGDVLNLYGRLNVEDFNVLSFTL